MMIYIKAHITERVPRHLVLHNHQAGRPACRHLEASLEDLVLSHNEAILEILLSWPHVGSPFSQWGNIIGFHPKRRHRLTAEKLSDRRAQHRATVSKPENYHQEVFPKSHILKLS